MAACEPFHGWWTYQRDFKRYEARLSAIAQALRASSERGDANAIGGLWTESGVGECNALKLGPGKEAPQILRSQTESLCALLADVARDASVEPDGTVWITTWSFGGALGHIGGVVLPGKDRRQGDTLVRVPTKYTVRAIEGVEKWMVWDLG
jgi:hypothetical protein